MKKYNAQRIIEMISDKDKKDCVILNYEKNDTIKTFQKIAIIKNGIVKSLKNDRIIKFYRQDDFINLTHLYKFENTPKFISCNDSEILYIPILIMKKYIQENIYFSESVFESYFNEINDLQNRIQVLSTNNAKKRMAETFVSMQEKYPNKDIQMPINGNDWACYMGMRTETFIRKLQEFRNDNIIECEKQQKSNNYGVYRILNIEFLKKFILI